MLRNIANKQYVLVLKMGSYTKQVGLILENQQSLTCAVSGLLPGEKVLVLAMFLRSKQVTKCG